jgi:tetratricopeptide (TPR) repeat protein
VQYSLRQVGQIVGIPPSAIRRLIDAGFVAPGRGKRREYRFSFRDLIVVRMAKALSDAKLSGRRISSSLKRLREQLPDAPPLAGLRIAAIGNDVVVMDGASPWRADDGQYVLAFDVAETQGTVAFAEPAGHAASANEDWFARGLGLEETDVAEAIAAYGKAVAEDSCRSGAYANWGRLLHQAGRLADAEAVYRQGAEACPDDAVLLFNLGVLKEDQGRWGDAIALYEQALAKDPEMGDAHYNLGLLYQARHRLRDAVRHFNAYRKLSGG